VAFRQLARQQSCHPSLQFTSRPRHAAKAARALRFLLGEDNQQEAPAMQQNTLDYGAFIRDINGNYVMARPATEAELIAQATAIVETRLRGDRPSNSAPDLLS
jgi:hypothetical protein